MDRFRSAPLDDFGSVDRDEGLRSARPWAVHYPTHLRWDIPTGSGTLPELLARAASSWGEKPAIDYCGHRISFSTLDSTVDRLAAGFIANGFGPRHTIALLLPNTPWHTVCFFAALKAGAKLVHLSPMDAPREIAFKLTDSGADLVVTTDLGGCATRAIKLVESGAIERLLVGEDAYWGGAAAGDIAYDGRVGRLADFLSAALPSAWPDVQPGDVALLQYTGGTTGAPKGAMLTHANMVAATESYLGWRDDAVPPSGEQRVIGVLPMFHIYALNVVLLLNIADGNEIMLRPRFDVATTIADIELGRATTFPAVPTMLIAMLGVPDADEHDYSSLTMVGSGGAPLPPEVLERAEKLFGQRLRLGWGMTETAAIGTRLPPGLSASPGVIGVPLPNVDMRIVSLTDPLLVLPPGDIGEIAVRGPNMFVGYWNQPELTAQSFADGFFLTGDVGSMDSEGLFTLIDRKKRMIISGGFNVYPTMIENAIYEHPDVEEVIVIGVPDQYRGETAKAFTKLRDGAAPLSLEDLRAFLADRVGRHEMPTALDVRDSLPKSSVGKLLASALAEEERARAKQIT